MARNNFTKKIVEAGEKLLAEYECSIPYSDNKNLTLNSYNSTADEYNAQTREIDQERRMSGFLSYLSPEATILDLGCGPGRDAKIFVQKGYKVIGVDFSPKMIALAQASVLEAEFFVADIEKLPFSGETFDAVWASASLLHIPKETFPHILEKIHSCLKGNGIFYVSMKQGSGEELKPDNRYGGVKKFWNYVQEKELVDQLTAQGFKILESNVYAKEAAYQTHPWIAVICKK